MQPITLPSFLQLDINGRTYQWGLGEATHYSEADRQRDRNWRMETEPGFNCACCSLADRVQANSNSFLLPHVVVEDWDGETFSRWVSRLTSS